MEETPQCLSRMRPTASVLGRLRAVCAARPIYMVEKTAGELCKLNGLELREASGAGTGHGNSDGTVG